VVVTFTSLRAHPAGMYEATAWTFVLPPFWVEYWFSGFFGFVCLGISGKLGKGFFLFDSTLYIFFPIFNGYGAWKLWW